MTMSQNMFLSAGWVVQLDNFYHLPRNVLLLSYKAICKYFGLQNFTDCAELAASLQNLRCDHNKVQDYVAHRRSGISCLHSANFPFSVHVYINDFVCSLPHTLTFATLRAMLPSRLDNMRDDYNLGAFITVTNDTMDLEIAFHNNTGLPATRHFPSCIPPSITQPTILSALPKPAGLPSSSVHTVDTTCASNNHSSLYCNNCKKPSHIDLTCFKEGRGLAGQCDEYLNDKSHMHVMFAECLESAFSVSDPIHNTDIPPDLSASPPPVIDDNIIVPIAAMCIPSTATNPDLLQDLYSLCDTKFPSLAFSGSVDFTTTALLSLTTLFNALLDSGCIHHIIQDHSLFLNYVSKPISIGTANCGSLQVLGTGDVSFCSPYGECHVLFTLRGCLHAPDAPINLFSVDTLVERGMSALFTPGGITKVSFCKGDCGAELNQILAGGPKLIYYNK